MFIIYFLSLICCFGSISIRLFDVKIVSKLHRVALLLHNTYRLFIVLSLYFVAVVVVGSVVAECDATNKAIYRWAQLYHAKAAGKRNSFPWTESSIVRKAFLVLAIYFMD